ncbi:hypothetical protein DWG18_02380 [Lysobacter sp. TY2-98]|uniref:hypothetical protein n=1 Tax=Lysobacter sp. TY2-98 TaxID=2290922 RepID=UPI000E20C13B|nr:hypothetical protein [Lysobacter sp. TY2-98]AXK71247.1 hypothetical protein DWG18_02380 [Lysobacter sp. TY2-98]
MIDLEPPLLVYSQDRHPFHDGMREKHACLAFQCEACGHTVERNVLSAVSAGTEWFRSLPLEDQRHIASTFSCTLEFVGPKALAWAAFPNGRSGYFSTARCGNCGKAYVVAIDFYEMQPARYIALLQGVAGLAPNNSSKPTPLRGAA